MVAEPLPPFQWIWAGLPLILILLGGMVGGGVGAAAIFVNAQIFRCSKNTGAKYLLSALISFVAFCIVLGVIVGITALT